MLRLSFCVVLWSRPCLHRFSFCLDLWPFWKFGLATSFSFIYFTFDKIFNPNYSLKKFVSNIHQNLYLLEEPCTSSISPFWNIFRSWQHLDVYHSSNRRIHGVPTNIELHVRRSFCAVCSFVQCDNIH